jgi:hypothetical protein
MFFLYFPSAVGVIMLLSSAQERVPANESGWSVFALRSAEINLLKPSGKFTYHQV